ncbi:hypothetical protein HMPREF0454_03125 [Hafnia alvei ATCC 51873]|uniref:Uncharacterized protein n=1 Tax=Hafnia alvei ATCC 51873 TaxID=1002364 RepID=G9Y9F7_HAFAL|nr:hypothetical protein HMPREF0454_03125 [Hafnia alvei ATCC 51873]
MKKNHQTELRRNAWVGNYTDSLSKRKDLTKILLDNVAIRDALFTSEI